MTGDGRVAREQAFFVRFLLDPAYERAVRVDPIRAAVDAGVSDAFVARLVALRFERIEAFRQSSAHKNRVRAGKKPSRLPL